MFSTLKAGRGTGVIPDRDKARTRYRVRRKLTGLCSFLVGTETLMSSDSSDRTGDKHETMVRSRQDE